MPSFTITEHGAAKNGLVFIFGGWKISQILYLPGMKRMNKEGLKCILFTPNPKILGIGVQYQELVDAVEEANTCISGYIDEYKDMKLFISMGISLGTLFASEITKRQPSIKRLILSAPLGDFNGHVSHWIEHRYFGKVIKSQTGGIENAVEVLNKINPAKDLHKLKGKEILFCYANNDKVTHTDVATDFANLIKKNDIQVQVRFNKGGHYAGIFKDYLWLMTSQQDFFKLP